MITQVTTPFSILQGEWVMLAPLGDHPHELGIQRFTPAFFKAWQTASTASSSERAAAGRMLERGSFGALHQAPAAQVLYRQFTKF